MKMFEHEVIGERYLHRWHIIPPNRWCTMYLHKFVGNDFRIIHDHPAASVSIRLKGELREDYNKHLDHETHISKPSLMTRLVPRVCFRSASFAHKLSLANGKPCWTLFIFGPRMKGDSAKNWGFFFESGWVSWKIIRDEFAGVPELYAKYEARLGDL